MTALTLKGAFPGLKSWADAEKTARMRGRGKSIVTSAPPKAGSPLSGSPGFQSWAPLGRLQSWVTLLLLTLALTTAAHATPTAPANVVATVSGSDAAGYTVSLSWTAISGLTQYNIYRSTTPGGEAAPVYGTSGPYTPSYTDYSVAAGVTYYYKISAVDGTGEGPLSAEVSATPAGTPPAAPVVTGTIGSGVANLTWKAVSGATWYNVYRGDINGSNVTLVGYAETTTTFHDTTVTNGQTYTYSVYAVNAAGQGAGSAILQLTPGTPDLAAPTQPIAQVNGDGTVTVSWTPVPGVSSNYYIYRALTPGGEGRYYAAVQYYTTSYTDYSVSPGAIYYYKVSALDANGEGPKSAEVSALPGAALLPASTLTGTASAAKTSLSWKAVSGAATYNLYRKNKNDSSYALLAYGLASTSYTDTRAASGNTYQYYVCAVSNHGQGTPSNVLYLTVGTPNLGAPANLVADISSDGGSIVLNWTSVPNTTHYYVYRSLTPNGEGQPLYVDEPYYDNFYTDSSVSPGVVYYYKVTALNANGESHFSGEISAETGVAPLAATVLSGTLGASRNTLTWKAVSGATGYDVYRQQPGVVNDAILVYHTTTLAYADTGAVNGNTYRYHVLAVGRQGEGLDSNAVYLTPGTSPDLSIPTQVVAAVNSNGGISLVWAAVPNDVHYFVYRSLTPGGEASPLYSDVPYYYNAGSYVDYSVNPGVTYYYKISALDSTGETAKSIEVSATPGVPALAASTLSGAAGNAQTSLSWSAVSGATSYDLYRKNKNDGSYALLAYHVTGLSYTDTGLTNGNTLLYAVAPVGVPGEGAWSNTVYVTVGVPHLHAPTNVVATVLSYGIQVTWSPIKNATHYYVYRSLTPGGEGQPVYSDVPYYYYGGSYVDTGVTPGITYYYTISTLDAVGEGPMSIEVSATTGVTPLPAPTLSGGTGRAQANLSWTTVPNATSYNVYRGNGNGTPNTLVAYRVRATAWADVSAASGSSYNYYVCSVNADGQGPASNIVYLTPGVPDLPAPVGLTASVLSYGIKIVWAAVPNASHYFVYRSLTPGGEGVPYYSDVPYYYNTGSYVDGNVHAGVRYYYKISALDANGESKMSAEVSAETGVAPIAAPTLSIGSYSATPAKLTWAAVSGATSYNIYRGDAYGNGMTLLAYKQAGTTYTDSTVAVATSYSYTVTAVGANGEGPFSNTVYVTPGTAVVGPPTSIVAVSSGTPGHYQISLNWLTVNNASSYYVYKSLTAGGETHPLVASLPYYDGNYTDGSVTGNTTYYYKLSSVDTHGESKMSAEVSATPGVLLPAPVVTAHRVHTANKPDTISLTWPAVSGATGYAVFSTGSGFGTPYGGLLATPAGTGYSQSVSSGNTDYYLVYAVNKNGAGVPADVTVAP